MHFHTLHPTVLSTLQPSTHTHPATNSSQMELGELVIFPTSPTGIPNHILLDHYCTCITRKFGVPLETLHQTPYQNTTIS